HGPDAGDVSLGRAHDFSFMTPCFRAPRVQVRKPIGFLSTLRELAEGMPANDRGPLPVGRRLPRTPSDQRRRRTPMPDEFDLAVLLFGESNLEDVMPAITADTLTLPRVAAAAPGETERPVKQVSSGPRGFEGLGFPVVRAFAGVPLEDLDPFVHMDEMGEV